MLKRLNRGARLAIQCCVAMVVALAGLAPVAADDITLSLKGGGGFQITGELKAFDGKKYVIINPSFGKMEADADRFDCVGGTCPTGPIKPPVAVASLFSAARPAALTIAGSNTVGSQLMPELVKAFADKIGVKVTQSPRSNPLDLDINMRNSAGQPVASISLMRQGSSTSFRALQNGEAQIGMSSRPIKDAEVASMRAAGLGNMRAVTHEHVVALDGLLILTSPNNPAISMSIDDVAKVFAGEVTDWAQLGFAAGPIKIHAPSADSGTWETFNTLVLKPRNLTLAASAQRTADHADQSDQVAADPLAIGVVGIAYQRSAKALNIENSCGLITPPSIFAIKTEEYPLARQLFLYTPGRPKEPLAAGLLDFALSLEAQEAVRRADFVDQSPDLISFQDQGSRVAYALNAPQEDFDINLMRTFLTDLKGAERLTYTFRFNIGSFNLDNKSKQNAVRLAQLLTSGELKDRPVKLLGFADSGGSFQTNLSLSESRARTVQAELIDASDNRLEAGRMIVKGYGELAPVACNDTPKGKAFNRRVEVWVDAAPR